MTHDNPQQPPQPDDTTEQHTFNDVDELFQHLDAITQEGTPTPPITCLNGPDECAGAVEYRMPLSGTGQSYPRCDNHWQARLDTEDRLRCDYPDSPNPPSWFDPAAAGEHWDTDY